MAAYSDDKQKFWIHMMERLNTNEGLYEPVPGLLAELCQLFSFGCGFIYRADYTGKFVLMESYTAYQNDYLYSSIDLQEELGSAHTAALAKTNRISFTGRDVPDALGATLAGLFNAKSLVMIPIHDHKAELMALVGILDRRGGRTVAPEDMDFAYSTLATLANHIKLTLFETRVRSTQRSLESILDNMGVDIYVNDFYTHEILYANQSMAAPFGGAQNVIGQVCWDVLGNEKSGQCDFCPQKNIIDEEGNPTKFYSRDYQRPVDGKWFRVISGGFRWVDGRLAHVVSYIDITENKINEQTIRHMAENDELTGLANRRKLVASFEREIPGILERKQAAYVLFLDLDGFKAVNDEMGHRSGDELLIQVGDFLRTDPAFAGKSYRYGGDEFVVIHDAASPGGIAQTVHALRARFEQPWFLGEGKAFCDCSIGVAALPEDDILITQLLHKADAAMYAAKRAGKGQACFYDRGRFTPADVYLKQLAPRQAKDVKEGRAHADPKIG